MAYLSINFGSGEMFEKSKVEKEGYEQYTYQAGGGGTAWRKKYKEIQGALVGAELKKVKFADKPEFHQFVLSLKDGEEYYNLQMDVLNNYGAIDAYLENFISKLPNLKKGEVYSLSSYSYTPENEKYPKRGLSIKQGDTKIERGLSFAYYSKADDKGNRTLVPGDIPAVIISEKKSLGETKKVFDNEAKTEYLFEYLDNWCKTNFPKQEGSDSAKTESKPSTSTKPKTREQEVDSQFTPTKPVDDDMGLPF